MLQQLIAPLLASALVFGSVEAGAQALGSGTERPAPPSVQKNAPPLGAGGPSGIRQAQAVADPLRLVVGGLIVTSIVVAVLLIEDDENTVSTATGTN